MAETMETKGFALRLSADEHTAVRAFAAATGTSANEVIRRAIREFVTGPARREEFEAVLSETMDQYKVALDKLADL